MTEIFVPTPEHEALRDLVRAREDARLDRMRARHRLGKFCLRHERGMPTTCWGTTRRAWLGRQAFSLPGQQQAFDDYLFAVDQVDRRIERLEAELDRLAWEGPHRELIARLRCMRGIDTLTAIGLVAEAGDFTRFKTAEQFMSFVGLVPSERSSGESRRQGSITKAGSARARRLLVEAAWNSRRRPTVGYQLSRRQGGQQPQVLERAWRCGAADELDYNERIILSIILEPGFHGTWTTQEIARAFGDETATADALAGLHAHGLIHRHQEYVFASRSAARLIEINEAA